MMNPKNAIPKDVDSHVAEILALNPPLVYLELATSGVSGTSAFAIVFDNEGGQTRVPIDMKQLDSYEKLLRNNGVNVKICFADLFP